MMKKLLLTAATTLVASLSYAQNPLSVHVLNLQDGLPSSEVKVSLEEQKNGKWVQLSQATTNEQGRIPALYPEGKKLEKGM